MQPSRRTIATLRRLASGISPFDRDFNLRWSRLILIYVASHGYLLLSWNALYWDDWYVYAQGAVSVDFHFGQCERCVLPLRTEVERILIGPGPWLMRLLIFLYAPLTTAIFGALLRKSAIMTSRHVSIATALVLLIPTFGARVALITYQYSFSLLLFVLGSWMFLSDRRTVRLSSLLPLFWALFIPSLQVFVLALLLLVVFRISKNKETLTQERALSLGIVATFPLIHRYLLPAAFDSLKITDGYNDIKLAFLLRAVLVTGFLVLPFLIAIVQTRRRADPPLEIWIGVVGLGLLGLGTFPYLAVGHFANLSDWVLPFLPDKSIWDSRHQLLQPFGLSLILLAIVLMVGRFSRPVLHCLLGVCLLLNVGTYSGYFLDWRKQEAIIDWLNSNSQLFSDVSAIVVTDSAVDFNARGRTIRQWEWEGMVERATGAKLTVGGDTIEFCAQHNPPFLLNISPESGRLKALISGAVALKFSTKPLPDCVG